MGAVPNTYAGPAAPRASAPPPAVARVRGKPDLLRISLCVLIVLSVSHIHQRYGTLEALRPGLLFTALALISAFMNPGALADSEWTRRWPAKVVTGLLVASLASIGFGISQGGAWWFFSNFFWKVIVTAFLLMAAIRSMRDLALFAWAYVVGSGILVYMALFVFQMKAEANGITRLSNLDTWDANDVCVLLLIGLAFCFLFLRTSGTLGRLTAGIIALGIGAAIARSGSRGGFLGLASLLIAYLISMKGNAKVRGIFLVLAVGLGLTIAAPTGYWHQMNTITSAKHDYNWDEAQGRRQLAIRGIGYMWSFPVFGLGIGNFGRAEGTISPIAGMKGTRWSAPHNSYVEAGAELGVPGMVLFLWLVAGSIVAPWRLRKRLPPAWETGDSEERLLFQVALYLPLCAIGFAIPAFFVSFAYLDPIYIVAAMNGAFAISVEARLRSAPRALAKGPARLTRRAGGWAAAPGGQIPFDHTDGAAPHRPARAAIRWAPPPPANPSPPPASAK